MHERWQVLMIHWWCVKHDDQHCNLIVMLCPNSSFLYRFFGILLDEKFLYRSVRVVFVNTKWYETLLERVLLLDPIIFEMWIPKVLSWAPDEHCNSHYVRHTDQDTLVVPCLRRDLFLYHTSVGGRDCGQESDASPPSPPPQVRAVATTWRILRLSQRSSLILIMSHVVSLCVCRSVSSLLVFLLLVFIELRHCLYFSVLLRLT